MTSIMMEDYDAEMEGTTKRTLVRGEEDCVLQSVYDAATRRDDGDASRPLVGDWQ